MYNTDPLVSWWYYQIILLLPLSWIHLYHNPLTNLKNLFSFSIYLLVGIYCKRRTMERGKSVTMTHISLFLVVCVCEMMRPACVWNKAIRLPSRWPTCRQLFLFMLWWLPSSRWCTITQKYIYFFFLNNKLKESKKKTFPFFSWRNKSI
jgi:hypothetical protein